MFESGKRALLRQCFVQFAPAACLLCNNKINIEYARPDAPSLASLAAATSGRIVLASKAVA
eukprot:scaffold41300_cov34-Phaeocystis_antarctica.AAC.1